MGTVIFIFHYVIALLMLYTILFGSCSYDQTLDRWNNAEYKPNNKRYKYPLWVILLLITVLFIPVLNIATYGTWMVIGYCNDIVWFKSFLTKRY